MSTRSKRPKWMSREQAVGCAPLGQAFRLLALDLQLAAERLESCYQGKSVKESIELMKISAKCRRQAEQIEGK